MGAPVAAVRSTPAGQPMPEGFKSTITITSRPSIQIYEREVKPGKLETPEIDTSTMFNVSWMTCAKRKLIKHGPVSGVFGYQPDALADIITLLQVSPFLSETITVTYPDGSTWAAFGFLADFEPQNLKIGEFPLANATFIITNRDSTGAEQGPVLVAVPGT